MRTLPSVSFALLFALLFAIPMMSGCSVAASEPSSSNEAARSESTPLTRTWASTPKGCGDFFLALPSADGHALLVVQADRKRDLGALTAQQPMSFDISSTSTDRRVSVRVEEYDHDISASVCSDVAEPTPLVPTRVRSPLTGTLILTADQDVPAGDLSVSGGQGYRLRVQLTDVRVGDDHDNETLPSDPFEASAGWFPG